MKGVAKTTTIKKSKIIGLFAFENSQWTIKKIKRSERTEKNKQQTTRKEHRKKKGTRGGKRER